MLFSKIMKGGGGGGTQTTTVTIPAEFSPYVSKIASDAQNMYTSGNFSDKPTQSAETARSYATAINTANQLSNTWIPKFQNTYDQMGNVQQLAGSQQLTDAMNAADSDLKKQYANVTQQNLNDAALSAGQFGGSRQGIAEGLAKAELDKNILNTNANMQYQALQNDIANKQQGLAQQASYSSTLTNLMEQPSNIYNSVGAAKDSYQDRVNSADTSGLQNYANLIAGLIPGTNSSTTASNSGGSKSGNFLSGAASGAMAGAMIPGAGIPGAIIGGTIGGLGSLF